MTHPVTQAKLQPITLHGSLLVNSPFFSNRLTTVCVVLVDRAAFTLLRQESCQVVSMTALQTNQTNANGTTFLTLAILDSRLRAGASCPDSVLFGPRWS